MTIKVVEGLLKYFRIKCKNSRNSFEMEKQFLLPIKRDLAAVLHHTSKEMTIHLQIPISKL